MVVAAERKPAPLTVRQFRAFLEGRPEREQWELIDGVAVMMTPPTLTHHRIASNLQRLLLDALDRHAPTLTAYQGAGLNVAPAVDNYDPEPDVVVIDAAIPDNDARYVDRFYLVAEVVSSSDRASAHKKREIYKRNVFCTCVLTIQQDRLEVRVDRKIDEGWTHQVLNRSADVLALDDFGLRCTLADLYRGTPSQAS
jgi:Uma2 family endonuclease